LRGRERGASAELIEAGAKTAMAGGVRCRSTSIVLDEIDAVQAAMAWANPGDVVVVCADKHALVLAELESRSRQAQAGAHGADRIADPDYVG